MAGEGPIAFGSVVFPSLMSLLSILSPYLVPHIPCVTSIPSSTFSHRHIPSRHDGRSRDKVVHIMVMWQMTFW